MNKRLALTIKGELTYCTSSEENIGKGRCKHIAHQGLNESVKDFVNSSSSPSLMKTISLDTNTPISSFKDGYLCINDSFGLKLLNGVQFKGTIIISGNNGLENKFLKLDELNPYNNMHYSTNSYDVLYSSVSEDICSKLLSNSDIDINSVLYSFENIKFKDEIKTGTISNNFIEYNSEEVVLSKHKDESSIIKHDDYIKQIIDKSDKKEILESMISFFKDIGVEKGEAKQFIINQAAFDLMTGNKDRKGNSTNFVFNVNYSGNVKPINIDYGRCLQSIWYESTEKLKID